MKRLFTFGLVVVAAAVVAGGCAGDGAPDVDEYTEAGPYRVGLTRLYFHDAERPFDAWNARYASAGYQAVINEINAAGERQIVAAHMWYPARADDSGRAASLADFFGSKSEFFSDAFEKLFIGYAAQGLSGPDLRPDESIFSRPRLSGAISEQINARAIRSAYAAAIADGRFPVIIAAHGLGGVSLGWASFAYYLASRGYVVIAPSFVSDSGAPHVLDSPDSAYFARAGTAGLERAYRTLLGESKVIPGFYKYFFGYEVPMEMEALPTGVKFRYVPGGGRRVGEMMGALFGQRVADLQTIIDGLESLDKDRDSCLADYLGRAQQVHGAEVCGAYTAALDTSRIGVMGHSLGSMSAQFVSARDDRVLTAVGYNNGPPRYWEPPGIFGDATAADGQPAGVSKPFLQIHGSEDAFVQSIFRGLMWNTLTAAGGKPEEIWLLAPERVLPSAENPQPIARNAYDRATGDKMIVSIKDVNHDSLVHDAGALSSKQNPFVVAGKKYWTNAQPARRKALGADALEPAFEGAEFIPLNWDMVGRKLVYLPTFLRNYYTRNWFDLYLKGERRARGVIADPPVNKNLLDVRASIPSAR